MVDLFVDRFQTVNYVPFQYNAGCIQNITKVLTNLIIPGKSLRPKIQTGLAVHTKLNKAFVGNLMSRLSNLVCPADLSENVCIASSSAD